MTDRLIDDLGRALARPITRRRTMRLFLAGGVALALPPLRPRFASAQETLCFPASEVCFERTCGAFEECCYTTDPTSMGCPYGSVDCCDPCTPHLNDCDSATGNCRPGPNTCDKCCQKGGHGECSDRVAYSCCAAGEIFTGSRCCKQSDFRAPCGIREGDCRDMTRKSADIEIDECDADFLVSALEGSFSASSARHQRCLRRARRFFTRRMEKCPESTDPGACKEGICNETDFKCDRECEGRARTPEEWRFALAATTKSSRWRQKRQPRAPEPVQFGL